MLLGRKKRERERRLQRGDAESEYALTTQTRGLNHTKQRPVGGNPECGWNITEKDGKDTQP